MPPEPLISVIVPSYRSIQHLKTLLNDFSNQTFRDFEMVLVRDGNPNKETTDYLNQSANNLPWLNWSWIQRDHNTDGPGTKARNYALTICKGQYVCYADDDDRFKSTYLEALIEVAGPNRIGVCQIYVQESRVFTNGNKERTISIPELGLNTFPLCGHVSSQCVIIPKKWALQSPWVYNYNHDFIHIKDIIQKFNPEIIMSQKGPQADLDGATIKNMQDWVCHPPFYRNNKPPQIR